MKVAWKVRLRLAGSRSDQETREAKSWGSDYGSRPDATPRALTAGLLFSWSFFNRLGWHSHSWPPRFAGPMVPLMGNRVNPVCYGSGEGFFSWGMGSGTRVCCREPLPFPPLFPCAGGQVAALALAERGPDQLPFWTQAEEAAKRSGAASRPGNEVFALRGRTGTGQLSCRGHRHLAFDC